LKNNFTVDSWRNKTTRMTLVILFSLSLLVASCGGDTESEEVVVIDSAYVTSSTYPPVPYPIQIEDDFEIKIGELFGYESFDWASFFPGDFGITTPEIIEGEGTVCTLAPDSFSVLGNSSGSCSVRYPSKNAGIEGFIFLTIKVTEG